MSNESAILVPPATNRIWELGELRGSSVNFLRSIAEKLGINASSETRKADLVYQVLQTQMEQSDSLNTEGLLEILPEGFGFLRTASRNYLPEHSDVYISPSQIRRFALRTGDTLAGQIRPPKNGERYFAMIKIESINQGMPGEIERKSFYGSFTPLHPEERFDLETHGGDLSARILDMLCPIGKGQRALIVSPPRAGKTVLLQSLAQSIKRSHPEIDLIVLLIGERPEEVTEMQRSIDGEVIGATFDEPAESHTQVAELVQEKAKRLVEQGNDVVILLDSITRLARAYNTTCPQSGKVLSGGVDANALHKPKRFFGAARNIEDGGSLTIIATALIDTGSRMDDVIFEEFKGTGNSEVVLSRMLAERRIWPAIDINRSGTRKEELLFPPEKLNKIWVLRKVLQPLGPAEAMQLLIDKVGKVDSNDEFLAAMNTSE
jgi:transcription termination factor Rho